jgi:hypothetical protein
LQCGGISGPAIFGGLIQSGKPSALFVGYAIGAVLMIGAGIIELWLGIEAAGREMEDIAAPLSAREAEKGLGEEADMFTLGRDRRIVRTTQAHEALVGRRVADVMVRDPVTVSLELPREQWATLAVRDRMHPVDRSLVVDAEEPLSEALRDLARTDVHRALVSDHGHLHSLLSMTDVARTFEVLAGEDIGYIGGTPHSRFTKAAPTAASGDGSKS